MKYLKAQDVSNRVNNSVFNLFEELGDSIYSSWNINHILEDVELVKERGENHYTVKSTTTGEIFFDGEAVEAKRWMKEMMDKIESDWRNRDNVQETTAQVKEASNPQIEEFVKVLEDAQMKGFVLREDLKSGSSQEMLPVIDSLKDLDDKISTFINFFKKFA